MWIIRTVRSFCARCAVTALTAALTVGVWRPADASAQLPLGAAGSPFEMTAFIQKATVDNVNDVFSGGTLKMNNHVIIVPRHTILQMPATALTWAEVFKYAPAPYGPTQSGMALEDSPRPPLTFEVTVQGNRVGDTYIAGLMFLSQLSLHAHNGFINYIDYASGELRVGGVPGSSRTGTRVRLNDPIGRFGRAMSTDIRFTIDEDNPTVRTETAYPVCVPRTNPAVADDPLCPQGNRPVSTATGKFLSIFTMPPPPAPNAAVTRPDPRIMAPLEIGDFVTYSGNVINDASGSYIEAWNLSANIGIFTAPGTQPVYVAIDVMLVGIGPNNDVTLAQEGARRARVEGFSTDATRDVKIYALDVDPCTGNESQRLWATQAVDPGPPNGAVRGRWRFRPGAPLFDLKAFPFLPATREMVAISDGGVVTTANGLQAGQYTAPNFEFITPENLGIGNPPVPINFQSLQFLAQGSGPWFGGGSFATTKPQGIAAQLSPWPGVSLPAAASCPAALVRPPVVTIGANQTVAGGSIVMLSATATDVNGPAQPLSYQWAQISGPPVLLSGNTALTAVFQAPDVPLGSTPVALGFLLTAENTTLATTARTDVLVGPGSATILPPTVSAGADQTVPSGAVVTLTGTASDPNTNPPRTLTFLWSQTAGLSGAFAARTAPSTTFTAPTLTPGAAPSQVALQLTASNGMLSASSSVNLTVLAPPVAPIATAVASTNLANAGDTVTLSGVASTDPNVPALPLAFAWTQVSGPSVTLPATTATQPNVSFVAPTLPVGGPGADLVFRVTVTNTAALSATADVTVHVTPPADTTPPTVTGLAFAPADAAGPGVPTIAAGATTFTVSVTAGDNVAVTAVQFSIDGVLQQTVLTPDAGTTNGYTATFTAAAFRGLASHLIAVTAVDAAGNSATPLTSSLIVP